jgi:hypothetical protein
MPKTWGSTWRCHVWLWRCLRVGHLPDDASMTLPCLSQAVDDDDKGDGSPPPPLLPLSSSSPCQSGDQLSVESVLSRAMRKSHRSGPRIRAGHGKGSESVGLLSLPLAHASNDIPQPGWGHGFFPLTRIERMSSPQLGMPGRTSVSAPLLAPRGARSALTRKTPPDHRQSGSG